MQEDSRNAIVAICYINHAFTSGLFSIGNDIYSENWIFCDGLSYFFPELWLEMGKSLHGKNRVTICEHL